MWSSSNLSVMTLIQSAEHDGHDPYRYLKDVLECLPTQPGSSADSNTSRWFEESRFIEPGILSTSAILRLSI